MTRDEIIRMARECGLMMRDEPMFGVERFAALVVSRHVKETRPKPDGFEREWLQQIAYQHGGIGDLCETEFEFGAMVAATEREACAKLAEGLPMQQEIDVRDQCAAAIRAKEPK